MPAGDIDLIAPCGMHCAVCSLYLAQLNGISRKRGKIMHCIGCRPRNKQCSYIKGQCRLLKSNKIRFCFECPKFPCERLTKIDARYRTNYGMSFIGNLEEIQDKGITTFLRNQRKRFACPECGRFTSVHNKKCFVCEKVTSWRG